MGILRSVADAVIVGAGTLRSVPRHVWTADYIYPELSGEFAELRRALGKEEQPLNVIVTGSGELDSGFAVLNQAEAPVLVLTTAEGARKVPQTPAKAEVIVLPGGRGISPQDVIAAA